MSVVPSMPARKLRRPEWTTRVLYPAGCVVAAIRHAASVSKPGLIRSCGQVGVDVAVGVSVAVAVGDGVRVSVSVAVGEEVRVQSGSASPSALT